MIEQTSSRHEPIRIHILRKAECIHPEAGIIRIMIDLPGIMPSPQKSGMLSGPRQRAFNQIIRQRNSIGNSILTRLHKIECRSKIRKIVAGFNAIQITAASRNRCWSTRQRNMGCKQVIMLAVRHRTNN